MNFKGTVLDGLPKLILKNFLAFVFIPHKLEMNSLNSNRFPEPRVQNCLEKKYEDIEF